MAQQQQLERLHRTCGGIKGSVTAFSTFLDTHRDKTSLDLQETIDVEIRLNSMLPTLQQFHEKHREIIDLVTDDAAFNTEEIKKYEFDNLYFTQIARAKSMLIKLAPNSLRTPPLIGSLTGPPSPTSTPTFGTNILNPQQSIASNTIPPRSSNTPRSINTNANINQVKLPKINLPTFAGVHDSWLEFRDKYISLLHDRSDIDEMQKFHYLRACLSGEASNVIQGVQFSAENYMEAWDILCARFDNPKVLMHNHIKAIFHMEPIQRESSSKLRSMLDNLIKHIGALNRLKDDNVDLFAVLVTYIVTSKLDSVTARDWEESERKRKNNLPTIENLKDFIRERADLLSTLEIKREDKSHSQNTNKHTSYNSSNVKFYNTKQNTTAHLVNNYQFPVKCALCKNEHFLRNCPDILKLSPSERYTKIKSMHRCINCLRFGHQVINCDSTACRICGKKHHTILHFEQSANSLSATAITNNSSTHEDNSSTPSNIIPNESIVMTSRVSTTSCILLSTALVNVVSPTTTITARVLLDTGSQSNFITQSLAKRLNLQLSPVDITVSGFSLSNSSIQYSCYTKIASIHTNFEISTNFLVTSCITGLLPSHRINTHSFNIPNHISLADPNFGKPGEIDMLIGVEHFYSLLCIGQISLGPKQPTLQKSKLGWLISGMAAGISKHSLTNTSCNLSRTLDDTLTRFWEIEEIPPPRELFNSHPCEKHFRDTIKRDQNGRFIVTIPTINLSELGDTYDIALKRFHNLERSLNHRPELKKLYVAFMNEYISLGHMAPSNPTDNPVYYLPHHGVHKESSTTTKLRVVFNGSAKPISGKSLNDCQLVGPCVQDDLVSILLRFRIHPIVFTADIIKMYRQVLVDPKQRSLQRVLWRSDPNEPIQSFDLQTITYGTASASFLSTRCLIEIANEIVDTQPAVSECIRHDFYVDDLLSGANNIEEAIQLVQGIDAALRSACMPLRKWSSNQPQSLIGLHKSDCVDIDIASFDNSPSSTLGLIWDSINDTLKYRLKADNFNTRIITKRTILSSISQIFDPLGLLSPCVITAKIIIQKLWFEKIAWDHSLPTSIYHEWINYRDSLQNLNAIVIPRLVICEKYISIQLHGFCDASIKAYGAVFYIRSKGASGNVKCSLLCAKGKVAPLKTLTVPRLELSGAYLLSRLCQKVISALDISFSSVELWCDSSIVLTWLQQCPSLLQTFVGNRVSKIQALTSQANWRYVPTSDNPADLLSRGVNPSLLNISNLWWRGPSFLAEDPSNWPMNSFSSSEILELRPSCRNVSLHVSTNVKNIVAISNFSSYLKLIRVFAYILRFVHNLRFPEERRLTFLSLDERRGSLRLLLRSEQVACFPDEINALRKHRPIAPSSKIVSLSPFLDNHGLLRVGGRLSNAQLTFAKKHPILLPNAYLSKLMFKYEHLRLLHIGASGLLSCIRENYWPLGGRCIARQVVHECISCFRSNPRIPNPPMGSLPLARVSPSPPFSHTGVDYAGPFSLKTFHGRGCKTYKTYVVLFVCFSTKAIHLELVTDLTTQALALL